MEGKEGALSSSTVGSIFGLQSEEISQIASEYAERVCPGWVRTDIGGANGLRSPDEGADTIVYCALLPKGTTSPNGELVYKRKILPWTSGK
ncbi:carbonyl reductase [NADPH] 1-like isoform X3 [Montipora capricornis]